MDFGSIKPTLDFMITLLKKIERHTLCTACGGVVTNGTDGEEAFAAVVTSESPASIDAGAQHVIISNNSPVAEKIYISIGGGAPVPVANYSTFTLPILPGGSRYPEITITGDTDAVWNVTVIN